MGEALASQGLRGVAPARVKSGQVPSGLYVPVQHPSSEETGCGTLENMLRRESACGEGGGLPSLPETKANILQP